MNIVSQDGVDVDKQGPEQRDHNYRSGGDIGAIFARGATAGLVGGLVFALANMWFAASGGKPAVAPFLAISTIFHASPMPVMDPAEVVIGLVTHVALSVLFGIVFAVAVTVLGLGRRPLLLVTASVIFGLALYVVNFQVFGRLFFTWFVNPNGPNQVFELWIHPVAFGLVMVPFFLGFCAVTNLTSPRQSSR